MVSYQPTSGRVASSRCIECGVEFTFIVLRRHRQFCSDACQRTKRNRLAKEAYLARPRGTGRTLHRLTCIECGLAFDAIDKRRQCCSLACGWKMGRRKQNVWRAEEAAGRHARVCIECGSAFLMPRPSGKARRGGYHAGQFCSMECAGSGKRWASYGERKRAIRQMTKRAGFEPREIFERDEWRCHLCGEPVDSLLTHPDPKSGCVNLIVPASKGGERTRENVGLAHLTCAVHRRARELPEV